MQFQTSTQLAALTAERDALNQSLATQTQHAAELERQSTEHRNATQTEMESLRGSMELKESERLRLLDEITALQQRDREAAERIEAMYTEIQKLVEQVCLLEQMSSSGVGSALDISTSSQVSGAGEALPMERLNTIIGYMREEKTRETELRMNAELEMQRVKAKCQLAEERAGKMEAELEQAKQVGAWKWFLKLMDFLKNQISASRVQSPGCLGEGATGEPAGAPQAGPAALRRSPPPDRGTHQAPTGHRHQSQGS